MRRFSKKRQAIYDCLCASSAHPTAAWIYQQLQCDFPDLSLGTVYRNLAQLKKAGLIQSVGVINGQERFDAVVTPHPHLICQSCGAVQDLPGVYFPPELVSAAEAASGYQISDVALCLSGRCPACLEKVLS